MRHSTIIMGIAACVCLGAASYVSAATIFSDDFSDANLSNRYTINSVTNSTFSGAGGQLKIVDNKTTNGAGTSITSTQSLNFPGDEITASFRIVSQDNEGSASQIVSLVLGNKLALVYGYTSTAGTNRQFVNLYVNSGTDPLDLNNGGSSGGGDSVWTSTLWTTPNLVPAGAYVGFRVNKDGWEVLKSSDGTNYTTLIATGNASSGTFASPLDLNFTGPVTIGTPNGKGGAAGATLMLDNVSVTVVPEPASLALLGLGGLLLLRRRK